MANEELEQGSEESASGVLGKLLLWLGTGQALPAPIPAQGQGSLCHSSLPGLSLG
jgi:hypothetical protein